MQIIAWLSRFSAAATRWELNRKAVIFFKYHSLKEVISFLFPGSYLQVNFRKGMYIEREMTNWYKSLLLKWQQAAATWQRVLSNCAGSLLSSYPPSSEKYPHPKVVLFNSWLTSVERDSSWLKQHICAMFFSPHLPAGPPGGDSWPPLVHTPSPQPSLN